MLLRNPLVAKWNAAQSPQTRLRVLPADEQVAAVCFRLKRSGIEFLLVRTGSGRWTFPKGCAEPGITRAQSAALEAFEEAGVHGRIEQVPFALYMYRKRRTRRSVARSSGEELVVHAHLCEVSKSGQPKEPSRSPSWFSIDKAKRKLRERRSERDGFELARVIDLAVMRVQSVQPKTNRIIDGLQKVKFDAFDVAATSKTLQRAAISRYIRREQTTSGDPWLKAPLPRTQRLLTGKVLPLPARKR